MKRGVIWLFFFILGYILVVSSAHAAEMPSQNLSISPIIQDLSLTPGKDTSYTITITNNASLPIGIHAQATPFLPDQLPDYTIYNNASNSPTFLQWIELDQPDILIPENSSKNIQVTIHTPKEAATHGYYAGITFTPFFNQQRKSNQPIILTNFVGLLFATVGTPNYNNLQEKTHIAFFHPLSWIVEEPKATFTFGVANDYFTHFSAKPFLTLKPLFGSPTTLLLEEKHILPGAQRLWNTDVALSGYASFYTAQLAVSVGNGKQILASSWIILLPYHILISITIALLVIFGALLRKRLWKAISILIKG